MMIRIDTNSISFPNKEIRLFAVVRNESLKLEFWLSHYRKIGVKRFFIVDNASTDATPDLLKNQPDVHLYWSAEDFQSSQSGRLWLAALMKDHGVGHWCIIADADELLAYPHCEKNNLEQLTGFLDAQGHDVLECILLDMYSDQPVCDTFYTAGEDLMSLCPWFDPNFVSITGFVDHDDDRIQIPTWIGSTRRKVFGVDAFLSKIALVRYHPEMVITRGQHGVVGGRPADIRGVMFHFKYLSDFPKCVSNVIEKSERKNCLKEWQAYHEAFQNNPKLSLFDSHSMRYSDSAQMIRLGLMKSSNTYDKWLRKKYNDFC